MQAGLCFACCLIKVAQSYKPVLKKKKKGETIRIIQIWGKRKGGGGECCPKLVSGVHLMFDVLLKLKLAQRRVVDLARGLAFFQFLFQILVATKKLQRLDLFAHR